MKKIAVICTLLIAMSCSAPKEDTTNGLDLNRLADQLIERAALKPGEKVLLMATPGSFQELPALLAERLNKVGAVYLGTVNVDSIAGPDAWMTDFVNASKDKSKEELVAYFSEVDLGIMLPGATPLHTPYAALQEVLRTGKGRTIHFHWAGAYDLASQIIPIIPAVDSLYQTVLANTDYPKLAAVQQAFEDAARKDTIFITTPEGTDLRMFIGDRPVTKQDGDASLAHMAVARNLIDREVELPAGAIRVAPIEESVNGTIAFPDAQWNGQPVKGLTITFASGKITSLNATEGLEHVKAELSGKGEAGESFRELAMGFNPLLAIPQTNPWIPYYGYGAGVVRLSLGDNSELGGKVGGGYVRWNFFPNATVRIGSVTWIDNGKLIR